jgi:DNA-binding response OmpR family regulator
LLLVLLKNKGTVFSRQQLIVEAWPENAVVSDRAVDVNITRMRKKIGKYSTFIVTRQGFGYSFSI